MRGLISFLLGALCLIPLVGCDSAASASHEDFTAKWSALAAAQQIQSPNVTPDAPIKPGVCTNCNGKGKVGDGVVMVTCAVCGGDGKVGNDPGPGAQPTSIEQVPVAPDVSQCDNPACECEKCKCSPCVCAPKTSLVKPVKEMPPVVPVSHPAPVPIAKAVAPSGHYEQRSYGRRGQFVQTVWVSHPAPTATLAGQCANGSCSAPQAATQSYGSCSSGSCSSCGSSRRGRR